MRRVIGFALLVACCGALLACKPDEKKAAAAPTGKPHWEYSTETVRGAITFYASLRSSNAPDGGAPASLLLTKRKGDKYPDNSAPVIVLKAGRFHCTGATGDGACQVAMAVDGNEPQTINAFDAGCGANSCLMISAPPETGRQHDGEPLIAALRLAGTVTLELPLDRHGTFAYRFDTAGLDWSRQTDRR